MYLWETHTHTAQSSPCAGVPAAEMVRAYTAAGYDGVVVTDHFSPHTVWAREKTDPVAGFFAGYRAAAEAAAGTSLRIVPGMELGFRGDASDFLVYGITEAFVERWAGELLEMGLERFSKLARGEGLLVYQAHPFRNFMRVMPPDWLDGIEVYNGNPRHDSRNEIARAWAERFGLRGVAGSDFHQPEDIGRGGIYTPLEIAGGADVVRALTGDITLKTQA